MVVTRDGDGAAVVMVVVAAALTGGSPTKPRVSVVCVGGGSVTLTCAIELCTAASSSSSVKGSLAT